MHCLILPCNVAPLNTTQYMPLVVVYGQILHCSVKYAGGMGAIQDKKRRRPGQATQIMLTPLFYQRTFFFTLSFNFQYWDGLCGASGWPESVGASWLWLHFIFSATYFFKCFLKGVGRMVFFKLFWYLNAVVKGGQNQLVPPGIGKVI